MTMPSFRSIDFYTSARGRASVVKLDQDTSDFSHLIGQLIVVDGFTRRCVAVERFAHAEPWLAGEPIALIVEPVNLGARHGR